MKNKTGHFEKRTGYDAIYRPQHSALLSVSESRTGMVLFRASTVYGY